MRILWIPHTGWHIPQRAHLFCRALAERHEIHVTDWVADFYSIRDYLSLRYIRNFTYRRYQDGNITVHGVPRISPALYLKALRQINTSLFMHKVQYIIDQHHIEVVVGTFVLPPPRAPQIVFDLFDENVYAWQQNPTTCEYANEIEQVEMAYMNQADTIVVASSVLVDKARRNRASIPIYHIPNGIDAERFKNARGNTVRRQLRLKGKVIGSVGNYNNPDELNLILDVAKILADITFVIAGIGNALLGAKRRVKIENIFNIVFPGYVPPDQLPHMIDAFDVGLCPYRKTPMDDARSPMRLLAYTALGLPSVCTNLEEIKRMRFPNVVLVGEDVQSFVNGIKIALDMKRERPPQIWKYDVAHLVDQYETVLAGLS